MECAIVTGSMRCFGYVNKRVDGGVEVLDVLSCADGASLRGDIPGRRITRRRP